MSQEMNAPGVEAVVGQAPKTSGFKGLYEVVVSPSAYFAKVKQKPTVLVPYIVLGLLVLFFFFMSADLLVDWRMTMPDVQEQMSNSGMSEAQMRVAMKYSIIGGGTIAMLLGPIVIAALAMFWGNFVMAGKARFKQLLSVALWGEYIFALGMLVTLPLMLAKGSIGVSLSLAAFLGQPDPTSVLYVALSKISVFHIWELIVIGFGLSIIYDFPRNKGMWLSVLSMGLLSILQVVTTGIQQLF